MYHNTWICHRYLECLFIPDFEDTQQSEMGEDLASYFILEMVVQTLDIYESEVYSLFQRLDIELIDFNTGSPSFETLSPFTIQLYTRAWILLPAFNIEVISPGHDEYVLWWVHTKAGTGIRGAR